MKKKKKKKKKKTKTAAEEEEENENKEKEEEKEKNLHLLAHAGVVSPLRLTPGCLHVGAEDRVALWLPARIVLRRPGIRSRVCWVVDCYFACPVQVVHGFVGLEVEVAHQTVCTGLTSKLLHVLPLPLQVAVPRESEEKNAKKKRK
jgi:hypothetical protein